MYTEKGSFGISISHLWTDYWIDFVAWPMISFCSDEPGVTAHICIRSYKTGRSLPHIYIYTFTLQELFLEISHHSYRKFLKHYFKSSNFKQSFRSLFCAVGVTVAVAGWLWLVVAGWLLVVAGCGLLMLVTAGWLVVVVGCRWLLVGWWLWLLLQLYPGLATPSLRPSDLDVAGAKMAYCVAASLRKRKVRS